MPDKELTDWPPEGDEPDFDDEDLDILRSMSLISADADRKREDKEQGNFGK